MKTNKELLNLLLKKSNEWIKRDFISKCDSRCSVSYTLFRLDLITTDEYQILKKIIKISPHPTYCDGLFDSNYYWEPYLKKPRIEWINQRT